MLLLPQYYKKNDRIWSDNVYKAMRNEDMSECVVSALNELRKYKNLLMPLKHKEKSVSECLMHLMKGKTCIDNGDPESAFWEYNKALLLAPQYSREMRLAFLYRAELSFKFEQYEACLKDLEITIALDKFPLDEEHFIKIETLKMEAMRLACLEKFQRELMQSSFVDDFFQIRERNPNIPCVSSDIEVIVENQRPKVVAARDIPTGTVVALETAFVSYFNLANRISTCYYCNKMSFSLIPCDGCCYTMFCDDQCKEQSMQEGHNVECKIMGLLQIDDPCLLAFQAILKMRRKCQSWDELILASHELGVDRMKKSSVADIFGADKFSLLNASKDLHFIYGAMFKNCMFFANVIYYLDTKTSFLPDSPEDKNAAIRAISRIMMHLSLCVTPVATAQIVNIVPQKYIKIKNHVDIRYFPFISNLRYSCMPNTYIFGTRAKAVLVTTEPIKKGTEITTVHYINRAEVVEADLSDIKKKQLIFSGILCTCNICVGGKNNVSKHELTDTQKKIFLKFVLEVAAIEFLRDVKPIYKLTCETLELLKKVSYSEEYIKVFDMFLRCIVHCIYTKYPNFCMSDDAKATIGVAQYLMDEHQSPF